MKFLLFVGLLAVIWLLWKKHKARDAVPEAPPPAPSERMVSCRHCGLLMPESDSVRDGADYFCCPEHRQAARSAGPR